MELDRRDFLKSSLAGAAGLAFLPSLGLKSIAKAASSRSELAMLVDVTRCIGCWWCYAACKNCNSLPETPRPNLENPPELSPNCWTTLVPIQDGDKLATMKLACMHCTDATCVEVCPTGALSHSELGFVEYDQSKCSGCGYCTKFCPFGVPQLEGNKVTGVAVMNKCTFCKELVTNGEPPACAAACPTEAIKFGTRTDLVQEGGERVDILRQTNPNAVFYGEKVLGGLHVMYVLDDLPEVYGLPAAPEVPVATTIRDVLQRISVGLAAVVVAGFGLNYLVARARMARREK